MNKKEFGDFQTPCILTQQIVNFLENYKIHPDVIIEPTCGIGNFVQSAYECWHNKAKYFGFELHQDYYQSSRKKFLDIDCISITKQDFFTFDWNSFLNQFANKKILIIGNPPWVTNSALGTIESKNLPQKSNFQGYKGFAAKTGKANFDIAEWMIIRLLESSIHLQGCLAFLCKTATARKSLVYFWKQKSNIGNPRIYLIDAKKHFNVAINACLLIVELEKKPINQSAIVYSSLTDNKTKLYEFAWYQGELVSDLTNYEKYKYLDGRSFYKWRSGIKHDAAKVMEFSYNKDKLVNGFGETVDIEENYLYPLLKSSDIGNGRSVARKCVLVTQNSLKDDPKAIANLAPKTWEYLDKYSQMLDNRKSSIYKNKPRFSIFGIGQYSFSKWKVAISSLYKNLHFSLAPPQNNRPTMVDDTCYFIPFNSRSQAEYWLDCFNSTECQEFLRSLIFFDAKRVVNVDILMRIDLLKLSGKTGDFVSLMGQNFEDDF